MRKVRLVDSTLRDGNHTVGNKFGLDDVAKIVTGLDRAGVDFIEVGYGFGMGSFAKDGMATDEQILEVAIKSSTNSKIAILVFPDKADLKTYEKLLTYDIGLVRLAVQAKNVAPAKEYIELANKANKTVGGFMMMASKLDSDEILEQAKLLESYGASSVTITDSAGAMTPSMVRDAINKVVGGTKLEVGFHTHDNLGLAVGNSMIAFENGASFADAALAGLGAGAGNTRIEQLMATLLKEGYNLNADLDKANEAIGILAEITPTYGVDIRDLYDEILIGYYGIYSAFMKNVNEISEKYNVNKKDLIAQIAKNSIVPGEEEKIEEIAKAL